MDKNNILKCPNCGKTFNQKGHYNRHLKTVHKLELVSTKTKHMSCSLCGDEVRNYEIYHKHLGTKHELFVDDKVINFENDEEYQKWKVAERLEVNYQNNRTMRRNDFKEVHYACNRSDTKGYKNKYVKRREKINGTIKIKGYCPSRIIIKLFDNGQRKVIYQPIHVGHKDELNSLHLTRDEEKYIVKQLLNGMSVEKVLKEAKNIKTDKLTKLIGLTRQDIHNLMVKYNVNGMGKQRQHKNKNDEIKGEILLEDDDNFIMLNVVSDHSDDDDEDEGDDKEIDNQVNEEKNTKIEYVKSLLKNIEGKNFNNCMSTIIRVIKPFVDTPEDDTAKMNTTRKILTFERKLVKIKDMEESEEDCW